MPAVPCASAFGNFLSRRTEHLDTEILRDWFPSDDAWVGHVSTGAFKAFDGTSHTYDRFHMAFPDLSGIRQPVDDSSCGTNPPPCDWNEKIIGYGSDRFSYQLARESYGSDLICWDQNLTIDQAVEKWSFYVEGLRAASRTINSRWFKLEALRGAGSLYLAGSAGASVPVSFNADATILDTGGLLPTSILTMPYLMQFVEPLQLAGYFQRKYEQMPMFKLITDLVANRDLQVANPTLTLLYRHSDFIEATGKYYKYGVLGAIGNFMVAIDEFPMRFVRMTDGKLKRIFPYYNTAATVGIKQTVSQEYINAHYQIDFIWHPSAMRILTLDPRPINKDMPFLIRDFAGKWRFAMDNLVINGCPIDNKRRNKGQFYADFESATKYERPELVRAILTLRNVSCVVDIPPCTVQVGYPTQDYNSANTPCPNPTIVFTPTPAGGPFVINANTITCNGVPIVHAAVGGATLADLANDLTAKVPTLGTWAVSGSNITLANSTCTSVTITFV